MFCKTPLHCSASAVPGPLSGRQKRSCTAGVWCCVKFFFFLTKTASCGFFQDPRLLKTFRFPLGHCVLTFNKPWYIWKWYSQTSCLLVDRYHRRSPRGFTKTQSLQHRAVLFMSLPTAKWNSLFCITRLESRKRVNPVLLLQVGPSSLLMKRGGVTVCSMGRFEEQIVSSGFVPVNHYHPSQ